MFRRKIHLAIATYIWYFNWLNKLMINWFWHTNSMPNFFLATASTTVYKSFGPLLDFEMTTVPHLHEYWSSRNDKDMQSYLIKKISAMNLLLQQHRGCRMKVTHEQKEKEISDTFVILIDAWLAFRNALLTLFLTSVLSNNYPARAPPSCAL